MAVFISVVTSPFEEVFSLASDTAPTAPPQNVRRPFRGIEVKRDTYATIKVYDALRRPIPFIDSSAPPAGVTDDGPGRTSASEVANATTTQSDTGQSFAYSNFILQSVQEQRVEKQQIVETFGEDYIFFFGERPRIYTFNAMLMNTRNFNWKSEWWTNYENTLRGTRLLEQNARMYIYYDDVVLEGYMLQAQAGADTSNPYMLPLSFQVFCTNHTFIGNVGSIFTPLADAAASRPPFVTGDAGISATEAIPDDPQTQANLAVAGATSQNSLTGFLRAANSWFRSSTFQIAKALENVKNTFYGQYVSYTTEAIGNQIYVPPIENRANFGGNLRSLDRQPIYKQRDEYTLYVNQRIDVQFDQQEAARVRRLLRLNSPGALEQKARKDLRELGLNVDRPNANVLLLGRLAFAAGSIVAPFGLQQAQGALDISAGVDTGLLTGG